MTDIDFAIPEIDHTFSDLSLGSYKALSVDVPWHYKSYSKKGLTRSADSHYQTMSLEEIAALPVGDLAAKDCHLFFWITGPNLARGAHLPIFKAWGFEPSSMGFVWAKTNKTAQQLFWDKFSFFMGMGHTTRQNCEFVILGRKGKPKRNSASIRQLVIAARREHSRKPDEVHGLIEQYCDGPYCELFAREKRPGWDAWGNETDKFGGPE